VPKIVLIRHAHSTANAAGVLSGQLPNVHLSKSGQEQAERLAERLGKLTIAQVQVSPMDRCSETLAPWLAIYGKNVNVITEPNLVEVDYGKWSGKKLATLSRGR
jgi:probable phosphoglycerate mutase